jgi:hypothetical protein
MRIFRRIEQSQRRTMNSTLRMFRVFVFSVLTPCAGVGAQAAGGDGKTLELLDESHGPVPSLVCSMPSCGTVISIQHHLGVEPVTSEDGSGVYFQQEVKEDLYPAPPLAPPIVDDSTLEKETQLWDIEVQMQDGTIQTVQQDFEPLFSIGATVVVDGDHVRVWE